MKPPYKPELRAQERASVDDESRRIHKHKRKPVVIYMVTPEVIHADASEFMDLVQRLTGPSGGGAVQGLRGGEAATPSSTSGHDEDPRQQQQLPLPVRVKARPWNRQAEGAGAPAGETLFFHDLSPPSGAVRKDAQQPPPPPPPPVAPHSWLFHGEHLDQSPHRHHQPGFLDVFGEQEQDQRR